MQAICGPATTPPDTEVTEERRVDPRATICSTKPPAIPGITPSNSLWLSNAPAEPNQYVLRRTCLAHRQDATLPQPNCQRSMRTSPSRPRSTILAKKSPPCQIDRGRIPLPNSAAQEPVPSQSAPHCCGLTHTIENKSIGIAVGLVKGGSTRFAKKLLPRKTPPRQSGFSARTDDIISAAVPRATTQTG